MSGGFKRLLAKSTSNDAAPRHGETLPGHAAAVCLAAETLLNVCGARATEQAGFDSDDEKRWFHTIVRGGAFLHDLGKAGEPFQRMVRAKGPSPQLIRHEALSAILALDHPVLNGWLRSAPLFSGADAWLVEACAFAAAGHHLKFHGEATSDQSARGPLRFVGAGDRATVYLAHPDFQATLSLGTKIGLGTPPKVQDVIWRSLDPIDDPDEVLQGALFDADRGLLAAQGRGARWWAQRSGRERRVFALAKAWVVAADVLGSALPKEKVSIHKWVTEAMSAEPSAEDLAAVVTDRLAGKALRPFQRAMASTDSAVTLVEAGCGTGKTAGAYQWAAERGRRGSGGKLFFAYPTTGTATEGFRGYVAGGSHVEARLVHSRASVDLDDLLATGELGPNEKAMRSEALEHLRSEVIVCTVDTVLGLIQNQRKGLFLSPAISTGRFVFDEVHAYDDRMFAALLDFLRTFPKAPVLLMSASVPAGRRAALEAVVGPLPVVERPADVEAVPRYEIAGVRPSEEVWRAVEECVAHGGKVLWVSNTVARAVKAGQDAEAKGFPVACYHSRFTYQDRVQRHRAVVGAFEAQAPCVAVTTQVAEMSLDLSADLLVTDLGPVPSLVQRLGRLNRRASPAEPGTPRRALALTPESPAPYSAQDIALGRAFWEAASAGGVLDQRAINELMHRTLGHEGWPPPGEEPAVSAWLAGGFESRADDLRDAESTVAVLHASHVPAVQAAAGKGSSALREALIRNEVPLSARPCVWGWQTLPEARFHPIAPVSEVSYDPKWGAQWVKNGKGTSDG
ncbi:MAG: CRISPR-associated helicase Cas3' [Polyangiales bacterium]